MGNERLKVGGRVRLNPVAGHPAGHILALHSSDSAYKGPSAERALMSLITG